MKILRQNQTLSLADIFTEVENQNLRPKNKETEYKENLLTLSVCLQRLTNIGQGSIHSLHSESLVEQITDEDRIRAEQIRSFYQKKLLHVALQGRTLTKYRDDLQKFLYNNTNKYTDSVVGMAYKLPYFYDYDVEMDVVFESSYVTTKTSDIRYSGVKKLQFVRSISNQQRYQKAIEYWFVDDLGDKYMLSFSKDDLLLPLFNKHISSGYLNLEGVFYKKRKDSREYFNSMKFSFT